MADTKGALDTLFLGLGAVSLLVGAVGVANIMVISVLERRQEIGLRRALGATRGQIRTQFLAEAVLLALSGGAAGVIAGSAATAIYAHAKGWPVVIPIEAWAGGLTAAIVIGAFAGLLPAIRAARCPRRRPCGRCEPPVTHGSIHTKYTSRPQETYDFGLYGHLTAAPRAAGRTRKTPNTDRDWVSNDKRNAN